MPVNKFGRKGMPTDWDGIKALWVAGQSVAQISKIFGINALTIYSRAQRGKWRALRNARKAAQAEAQSRQIESEKDRAASACPEILTVSHEIAPEKLPKNLPKNLRGEFASPQEIVERALPLASSIEFRSRVIKANDRALKVLEGTEIANVGDVDRFAEALTKVERIGARTYGYDREANQPAVNIAVLTSGSEYD
jgi:hypothetical protein